MDELEGTDGMIFEDCDRFSGFVFTGFAEGFGPIEELPVEAILQDVDGVFCISDEISTLPAADENFMELVDSVIRQP